jgi:hypothetical protein
MDERPDEIIGHIEAQRDQLGRNLNELETRVRRSTDWRTYYDRNPMLMMGAALGGGLLLGSVIGSKTSGKSRYSPRKKSSLSTAAMGLASAGTGASAASWSQPSASHHSQHALSHQMSEISRTMDHVKTALIAFGIAKAKEFLSQAVPGLEHHLSEAEHKHQHEHGSTEPARHFSDLGAFAQESGGTQPSRSSNWESDMYRSSGQFRGSGQPETSGESTTPGHGGSADYHSGNRSSETPGTRQEQQPTHQY